MANQTLGQVLKANRDRTPEEKSRMKGQNLRQRSEKFDAMCTEIEEYFNELKDAISSDILSGEEVLRYKATSMGISAESEVFGIKYGKMLDDAQGFECADQSSQVYFIWIDFKEWLDENDLTARAVVDHDGSSVSWNVVCINPK